MDLILTATMLLLGLLMLGLLALGIAWAISLFARLFLAMLGADETSISTRSP